MDTVLFIPTLFGSLDPSARAVYRGGLAALGNHPVASDAPRALSDVLQSHGVAEVRTVPWRPTDDLGAAASAVDAALKRFPGAPVIAHGLGAWVLAHALDGRDDRAVVAVGAADDWGAFAADLLEGRGPLGELLRRLDAYRALRDRQHLDGLASLRVLWQLVPSGARPPGVRAMPNARVAALPGSWLRVWGVAFGTRGADGDGLVVCPPDAPGLRVVAAHGDLVSADAVVERWWPAMQRAIRLPKEPREFAETAHALAGLTVQPPHRVFIHTDRLVDQLTGCAMAVPPPFVRIRAVHGGLEWIDAPVLVAHFRGDELDGTAAALDHHLSGGVRGALDLADPEDRPVRRADARSAAAPKWGPPFGLVAPIVGRTSVDAAWVTKTAFSAYDDVIVPETRDRLSEGIVAAGEDRIPRLAAVLMGSRSPGDVRLTVEDSARALVAAAVATAESGHDVYRLPVVELILIDVYEDRILRAAHAAAGSASGGATLLPPGRIERRGAGGRHSGPAPYRTAWWPRLELAHDPTAGVVRWVLVVDGRRQVHTTPWTPSERLTTPRSLLPALLAAPGIVLVDPNATVEAEHARLPGERGRSASGALATRVALIREHRSRVDPSRPGRTMPSEALVLVGGHEPTSRADDEAELVASELARWCNTVERRDPMTPEALVEALGERRWDIVHYVGHGAIENGKTVLQLPRRGGKAATVDASAFRDGLGDHTPILVVLNACQQAAPGTTERTTVDPAQDRRTGTDLASLLLERGVKTVLASFRRVHDEVAYTFARTFYPALRTRSLGDAVRSAREACARLASDSWEPFVCWGHPGLTLVDHVAPQADRPLLPREVADVFHDLTRTLQLARGDVGHLVAAGRAVLAAARDADMLDAEALTAAATFFGQADQFGTAILLYEDARRGDAPTHVHEQLANLMSRRAARIARAKPFEILPADAPGWVSDPEALFARAVERIEWVLTEQRTVERLMIAGSHHRNRALVSADFGGSVGAHLDRALDLYTEAYQRSRGCSTTFYPGLNLYWIRRAGGASHTPGTTRLLNECAAAARQAARAATPFWGQAALEEIRIITTLDAHESLRDETVRDAIRSLKRVLGRATPRERDSVVRALRDTRDLFEELDGHLEQEVLGAVVAALETP